MTATMPATITAAADLFRAAPQRYIDVGRGEVAYRRVGQGPDVIFVHGWPVNSATFHPLLPHLTPHVTCHLFDLVGTGQSRFDRQTPVSLSHHLHTIKAVIDHLDLDDYAIVGHDSGGMLARHATAGDPRLRGMGLIDTEHPSPLTWRFRMFLWARGIPGFPGILAWAANTPWLRRNPLLLGDAFADRALLDGTFDEFFLAPLQDDADLRWACGALLRSFDMALVDQLPDVHARITAPVQLVWGADDPFFPVEQARAMLGTFADARLHVVEGGKLFVHEERPAEVAEALLPTLLGTRS